MGSWIYTQGNHLRRRRRFPPFIPAIHGEKEEEVERNILRQLMKNDVCGGGRTEAVSPRQREGRKNSLPDPFSRKEKEKKGCCGRSDSQKKEAGGRRWANENLPHFPFTPTPTREREEEKNLSASAGFKSPRICGHKSQPLFSLSKN